MEPTNKPWYQSKTIIGATLSTICGASAVFGLSIGQDTQSHIIDIVLALGAVASSVFAIYGRVKATKPVN